MFCQKGNFKKQLESSRGILSQQWREIGTKVALGNEYHPFQHYIFEQKNSGFTRWGEMSEEEGRDKLFGGEEEKSKIFAAN